MVDYKRWVLSVAFLAVALVNVIVVIAEDWSSPVYRLVASIGAAIFLVLAISVILGGKPLKH